MKTTVMHSTQKEILPLKEAKQFLRISHDQENDVLQTLISSAIELVEDYTRRRLRPEIIKSSLPFEPDHKRQKGLQRVWVCADRYVLFLPHGPVKKVLDVQRILDDGSLKKLRSQEFHVNPHQDPPLIVIESRIGYGVEVTYEAGYDTVPPALKQAILQVLGQLYRDRCLDRGPVFDGIGPLLAPYTIGQGDL